MIPGSGLGLTASSIKPGDVIATPYGPAEVRAGKPWGYSNGSGPTQIVLATSRGTVVLDADAPFPHYRGCTKFCAQNHRHI